MFTEERLVRKFDKVRLCVVTLTELAMTKPVDHIFEGDELYWMERGEDDYGWPFYKDKIAVKLCRRHWLSGEKIDGLD